MAIKNHLLDSKIIKSAKLEFMKHGYQKASLHKIADNAGITTGALYTRYKSKDDLFCSLIDEAIQKIKSQFLPMQQKYNTVQQNMDIEYFLNTIKDEEKKYLDILFEYYDECVLLICKSDGSSIGNNLVQLMEHKANETVEFFRQISRHNIDWDGLKLIMQEQFLYYRQILEQGYTKEKAITCMKIVDTFVEAGWKKIFELII